MLLCYEDYPALYDQIENAPSEETAILLWLQGNSLYDTSRPPTVIKDSFLALAAKKDQCRLFLEILSYYNSIDLNKDLFEKILPSLLECPVFFLLAAVCYRYADPYELGKHWLRGLFPKYTPQGLRALLDTTENKIRELRINQDIASTFGELKSSILIDIVQYEEQQRMIAEQARRDEIRTWLQRHNNDLNTTDPRRMLAASSRPIPPKTLFPLPQHPHSLYPTQVVPSTLPPPAHNDDMSQQESSVNMLAGGGHMRIRGRHR
ncbi:MAG: hypothetical protein A3I12_02910 [Gammaproteobacteria bacterium RIFCSPLOWO2_02_FULL_38_11]|nr:MAG: hypothetical protein A3I12_02910 [Gammaproteobacteria bacterium RIFCSPLOWO2_02_FULL_38_11]